MFVGRAGINCRYTYDLTVTTVLTQRQYDFYTNLKDVFSHSPDKI